MILWITTVGEKGESGFNVDNLVHASERFTQYKEHWDQAQSKAKENPYKFTAKLEGEKGNMMPWKEFKKHVK
jgi:hypothetical protein